VRIIHVGNGEPVEYGQLLFELEPFGPQPVDAL
jgi:biotin carboxyl carrier protein